MVKIVLQLCRALLLIGIILVAILTKLRKLKINFMIIEAILLCLVFLISAIIAILTLSEIKKNTKLLYEQEKISSCKNGEISSEEYEKIKSEDFNGYKNLIKVKLALKYSQIVSLFLLSGISLLLMC